MSRSRINNIENQAWTEPSATAEKLPLYLSRQLRHLEHLDGKRAKRKYIAPVVDAIKRGLSAVHETNRARGLKDHTLVLPK